MWIPHPRCQFHLFSTSGCRMGRGLRMLSLDSADTSGWSLNCQGADCRFCHLLGYQASEWRWYVEICGDTWDICSRFLFLLSIFRLWLLLRIRRLFFPSWSRLHPRKCEKKNRKLMRRWVIDPHRNTRKLHTICSMRSTIHVKRFLVSFCVLLIILCLSHLVMVFGTLLQGWKRTPSNIRQKQCCREVWHGITLGMHNHAVEISKLLSWLFLEFAQVQLSWVQRRRGNVSKIGHYPTILLPPWGCQCDHLPLPERNQFSNFCLKLRYAGMIRCAQRPRKMSGFYVCRSHEYSMHPAGWSSS